MRELFPLALVAGASVHDAGKVVFGAGYGGVPLRPLGKGAAAQSLPASRVWDAGKVQLGAGFWGVPERVSR